MFNRLTFIVSLISTCAMADLPTLALQSFRGVLISGFTERAELNFTGGSFGECEQQSKSGGLVITRCVPKGTLLNIRQQAGNVDFSFERVSIMQSFSEDGVEVHRGYLYGGTLKTVEHGVPLETRIVLEANWGHKRPDRIQGTFHLGELNASFEALLSK